MSFESRAAFLYIELRLLNCSKGRQAIVSYEYAAEGITQGKLDAGRNNTAKCNAVELNTAKFTL